MKYSTFVLSLILLMGAGCSSPPPDVSCTTPPQEDESGSLTYPIAARYSHLPHLGQIYTALDCKNPERAAQIQGMKNGAYIMGVRLRWPANMAPSAQTVSILEKLHFLQESPFLWSTTQTLSMDDLQLLQSIMNEATADRSPQEDCILCG